MVPERFQAFLKMDEIHGIQACKRPRANCLQVRRCLIVIMLPISVREADQGFHGPVRKKHTILRVKDRLVFFRAELLQLPTGNEGFTVNGKNRQAIILCGNCNHLSGIIAAGNLIATAVLQQCILQDVRRCADRCAEQAGQDYQGQGNPFHHSFSVSFIRCKAAPLFFINTDAAGDRNCFGN